MRWLAGLFLAGTLTAQAAIIPPMVGHPPKPRTHSTEFRGLWSYDSLEDTTWVQKEWLPTSATWNEWAWTTHARPAQSFGQSFYFRHKERVRVWFGAWDGVTYTDPDTSKLKLVIDRDIDHGRRPFDGTRKPYDKVFKLDTPYVHTAGDVVLHLQAGEQISTLPCPQCWFDFEMFYEPNQNGPWLADEGWSDTPIGGCGKLITHIQEWKPRGVSLFRVFTTTPGVRDAPYVMAWGTPYTLGCARVQGVLFIPGVLQGLLGLAPVALPQQDFELHYQFWVLGAHPDPAQAFGSGHRIYSRGWTGWKWRSYTRSKAVNLQFESVAIKIMRLR